MKHFKILLSLVSFLFILSCSQDEEQNELQNRILELKFEDTNLKSKQINIFKTYSVEIISFSPLVIESDELEVIEITSSETGKLSYAIVKKNTKEKNALSKTNAGGCVGSIEKGYWYDGYDCFIWGTIVTGSDCTQMFFPSDPTTQYIMNNCGWSNVA